MKNIKPIDKDIYRCSSQIGTKYANSIWWTLTSVVGIVCLVLYMMSPAVTQNAVVGTTVLVIAFCGVIAAVTQVLYYLFGDSKRPYYKPTKAVLERCERYYDEVNSVKVGEYLQEGNFAAISHVPRAYQPLYLLVMYRSEGGEILCAQMVDKSGVSERAMTEIEIFEKGAYELPESLIRN